LEDRRLYKYDVLRFLCIFSVILLHLGSQYTFENYHEYIKEIDYKIGLFTELMTRTAVPCFVMLSGAFLINEKNRKFSYFYKKMWHKLVIPTVIFSLIYVLYAYLQIIFANILHLKLSPDLVNPLKPIIWLIQGRPHAIMWYIYMLLGIYVVTPLIIYIKSEISQKQFYKLSIVMLIYGIVVHYTCNVIWILQFVEWIGFFMLGVTIKEISSQKGSNIVKGGGQVAGAILLLFFNYYLAKKIDFCSFEFREAFNPIIVFATILLFSGFSRLEFKKNKFITETAKNTLWIYLLHILFIDPLFQICGRKFKQLPGAQLILPYSIIVLIICLKCSRLARKIGKERHF